MTLVMGVDPGLYGALAVCDSRTGALVSMEDMPTWFMAVGKTKRARVDAVALADMLDFAKNVQGVELVVIEAVGGRPKQSASSGFVFGYSVGLLYMACIQVRLPIETVPPATWKRLMRLPGKKKATTDKPEISIKDVDAAIVHRADEVFPDSRDLWRGPRGGYKLDRAEAALLARFGVDHILRSLGTLASGSPEERGIYARLDLGA